PLFSLRQDLRGAPASVHAGLVDFVIRCVGAAIASLATDTRPAAGGRRPPRKFARKIVFHGRNAMKCLRRIFASHPAVIAALKAPTVVVALACIAGAPPQPARAQQPNGGANAASPTLAGMIAHMQAMRQFKDADHGVQAAPPVIPR